MTRMRTTFLSTIGVVFFILLPCIRAQANPITIDIANIDHLNAAPGGLLTLLGTLANMTSATVYVNSSGGALNINQPPDATIVLDATYYIRPNLNTYILRPGQTT